jgi:hypothetical protein
MHSDRTDPEKIKFIFAKVRELKYIVPENLTNHLDIFITYHDGGPELKYSIKSNLRNVASIADKIKKTIVAAALEVDIGVVTSI